jgi:O-antigen/teichoic acid export membrane protein
MERSFRPNTLIGRRSVVILAARLISSALAFVGLFFITRYMGKDVYGQISFSLALVATFAAVSDLGFSSAHIKRVSEGRDINDCVSTFAAVKLVLTGVFVAVTLASLVIWTTLLGGSISQDTLNLALLFLLYNVLYQISSIATFTYTATLETVKANLVTLIDPVIRIPLVAFVAVGSLGIINLAYAYVAAAFGVVFVALFLLFRDRIKLRRPRFFRSYLSFAAPIALITIISTISAQLFVLMIGLAAVPGQEGFGAVGQYSGCLALLSILGLISASVATMTFPSFSKMHTDGDLSQIRRLTYQAERYISMIGLPILLVITLFPTETAHILLGPDYIGAGDDMRILAIATFIVMINSVHGTQINAVNRPELGAKLTILSFVVGLVLLLILVPRSLFGFLGAGLADVGAAIAYLGSAVVVLLATRLIVHRLTKTLPNPRLGIHMIAAVAAAAPVFFFGAFFVITGWWLLVIAALVSYVIFGAVLYVGDELHKEDISYFLDLLNVRKMSGYIREELRRKPRTQG